MNKKLIAVAIVAFFIGGYFFLKRAGDAGVLK